MHRRKFFVGKMTGRLKSLMKVKELAQVKCSELQEQNYLTQLQLENERKENTRLRLYFARCKDDIAKQFPKPEVQII